MKSRALSSQHQKIKATIDAARRFDGEQLELQSHFARYICILTSGFLENSIKELYSEYAKNRSDPTIVNFVASRLNQIQNPKAARFLEVARSFNKDWEAPLIDFMDENGRKDAIDSIMSNRHLIAHGKDSGISIVRVQDYLNKATEVLEFIEQQCSI